MNEKDISELLSHILNIVVELRFINSSLGALSTEVEHLRWVQEKSAAAEADMASSLKLIVGFIDDKTR